jgi:hypothetical protein
VVLIASTILEAKTCTTVKSQNAKESILTSDDGLIIEFLPPNVTAVIQPTDQEVIVSLKRRNQADLLRTLANEDDSIIALWKKNYGAGCYMRHILDMVFHESSNAGLFMEETSSRSRR